MTAEAQRRYKAAHPERVRATERAYTASVKGRATRERARKAFRARNPVVVAAHAAVTKAVLRGQLTRLPCQVCGDPKTDAHHHRGYEREVRLDVVWLCRPHHQQAHGVDR